MKKVASRTERVDSKRMAECEKLGRVERRLNCCDCSRLPEKKTRIRGETFEGKKGGGENRGNREVVTAGRENTRVQERKRKEEFVN